MAIAILLYVKSGILKLQDLLKKTVFVRGFFCLSDFNI